MGTFEFYDYTRSYRSLPAQHEFKVRRVNVHAGRGDNDLFFSTFEKQSAFRSNLAHITGGKPAVLCCSRLPVFLPISRRNVLPAHQNLSVLGQFHFLTTQYFADGAAPLLERVVNADERRRLGHAVALNHGESEPLPELLGIRIERRAA